MKKNFRVDKNDVENITTIEFRIMEFDNGAGITFDVEGMPKGPAAWAMLAMQLRSFYAACKFMDENVEECVEITRKFRDRVLKEGLTEEVLFSYMRGK